jgi:CheY-like chemotaxis protein/fructose-1,6-bisphosphatase/inositol monophosphatase family enzyme
MIYENILVVDDSQDYREKVKDCLENVVRLPTDDLRFRVRHTESVEQARQLASNASMIILDNRHDGGSYWQELLADLRRKKPDAFIVLVSQYSDRTLRIDTKESGLELTGILESDPHVTYLPKDRLPYKEHLQHLAALCQRWLERTYNRRELQLTLLDCAREAAGELRDTRVSTLMRKVQASAEKDDTRRMDIVAERCIKSRFAPKMHSANVLICTEEAGLHNELFHRVMSPEFYVFSDPFDGSSGFKNLAKHAIDTGKGNQYLRDVSADKELLTWWGGQYGWQSLNAPMVSIVLAERHRVVGAVLVNLFTQDCYISIDSGNYYSNCGDLATALAGVRGAISDGGLPTANSEWRELVFKNWKNVSKDKHLFLCSLGAVAKDSGKTTWINAHAESCLSPMLRGVCDWSTSFDYRRKQNDFTPGPGRVIFMTNCTAVAEYEKQSLDGNGYSSILSAGEPLTEWIGWFAFLRHARGVSAYCLRRRGEGPGQCKHRHNHEKDPASLLPDRLASIFHEGYMDLGVLHTAYGREMRRYHDTILVAFDADEQWRRVVQDGSGSSAADVFVRIPLYQKG